ncbi:hypothetical protein JCM10212_005298 [Sporobolomyces blumeae]
MPSPATFASLPALPSGIDLAKLGDTFVLSRRYTLVWYAILCYDTLATLPDERRFMWRNTKWTPMRALFFLNRSGAIVLLGLMLVISQRTISTALCSRISWFGTLGATYITLVCACIAAVRVYGLYGRTKTILVVLVVMVAAQLALWIGAATQLVLVTVPPILKGLLEDIGFRGCGVVATSSFSLIPSWMSIVAFDSIILLLIFFRSVQVTKVAGKLPIVEKLRRDGFVYFGIITSSNIVCGVLTVQSADTTLRPLQVSASLTLTSLMSARIILSLFKRDFTPKISGLPSSSSSSGGQSEPRATTDEASRAKVQGSRRGRTVEQPSHARDVGVGESLALEEIASSSELSKARGQSTETFQCAPFAGVTVERHVVVC